MSIGFLSGFPEEIVRLKQENAKLRVFLKKAGKMISTRNREAYNAYQREYQRKRRAAKRKERDNGKA